MPTTQPLTTLPFPVSFAPINNLELQAARKLLMLEVSEAAEEVDKVSVRSWQYWESGRSPVPVDVRVEINALLEERLERMRRIDDQLASLAEGERLSLRDYLAFEQYTADHPGASHTLWRIDQGIAAIYYTKGLAELV